MQQSEHNPEPTPVAARLTLTHRDGCQTIVEVHADASYTAFYRWYQRKADEHAKHLTRTAMRNDAADLEEIERRTRAHFDNMARHSSLWLPRQVVESKLLILDGQLYKKLLKALPGELPGGGPARLAVYDWMRRENWKRPRTQPTRIPATGYTPLQRRMDILTGKV